MAQVVENLIKLSGYLLVNRAGNAYSTWIGYFLNARCYVDPVTQQVNTFGNDVTDVDTYPEPDLTIGFDMLVAIGHAFLKGTRAPQRVDGARELNEQAVTGSVGDTPTMLVDQPVDQFPTMSAKRAYRTFLVLANQAGVACNICGHNYCQPAFLVLHRRPPL